MQFMDAIGCSQTQRVVDWTNLLYFGYIYLLNAKDSKI